MYSFVTTATRKNYLNIVISITIHLRPTYSNIHILNW